MALAHFEREILCIYGAIHWLSAHKRRLFIDHAFLASSNRVSSSINKSYWKLMIIEWVNSANESY